ncbi:MAG: hypothetical protein JNK16_16735, partial [Phycisphaerales bacterium]|nr:hypothetical protein [Phycisphaerales bacterium]
MQATAPTSTTPASAPEPATPAPGGAMTSGKLAEILKGELLGSPDVAITGISAIDQSRPGDLTFIRSTKFAQMWDRSKASVAIVVQEVGPPKSVAEGR